MFPIGLYGRIVKNHKFIFYTEAELVYKDSPMAKATGKFMKKQ
jgi:hypothetical protein